MKNQALYLMFFFLLASGCQSDEIHSVKDLMEYVKDESNGLSKSRITGDLHITVNFLPADLLIYNENSLNLTQETLVRGREKYRSYYYFQIQISSNGRESLVMDGDPDAYGDLVNIMSFGMHEFVNLTTESNDTIPLADFILDRTYGMASSTNFMFVFEKENRNDIERIRFNLAEFGLGTGNQQFEFLKDDLDDTPTLAFNLLK